MQINGIFFLSPYPIRTGITTFYTEYIAYIDEQNCIGCTRCIAKCPADAIVGSKKMMHTIISQYCTGCTLCTLSCPTDCISMKKTVFSLTHNEARLRYQNYLIRKTSIQPDINKQTPINVGNIDPRKRAVADAILRAKLKQQQLRPHNNQNEPE